ncbi:MAG: L-2-amino-thiazoline-4-carboxylic acid hydrolase [Angelakisella sp.]
MNTGTKVKNEAKLKNPVLQAIREQLEHRALWLYLLCDEAGKKGLTWEDFGKAATKRCGLWQGAGLVKKGGTQSLTGLKKTLFSKPAQWVFEMKIKECTDDKLSIDFHYCPLVKAWQRQGCTDEEIATLCDIAMCGDRGIAESYGCVLDLPKTIAKGDDVCEIRFRRENQHVK